MSCNFIFLYERLHKHFLDLLYSFVNSKRYLANLINCRLPLKNFQHQRKKKCKLQTNREVSFQLHSYSACTFRVMNSLYQQDSDCQSQENLKNSKEFTVVF